MATQSNERADRAHRGRWQRTRMRAGLLAVAGLSLLPAIPATSALTQAQTACPVISGYVYYDINNNGLRDAGEPAISGSTIELRGPGGTVVASDSSDGSGYYEFVYDASPTVAQQTSKVTALWPTTTTDWTIAKTLPQFNPALGTLRKVEVTVAATITSTLKAESLDLDEATITGTVGGVVTASGPGGVEAVVSPTLNAGSFEAEPYDGDPDFEGPSGFDFGAKSASNSKTTTVTDPSQLAAFTGQGNVTFTAAVIATSKTTGGGNVLNEIHTKASAEVTIIYSYTPPTCIKPGSYTIVQTPQPGGYTDGRETRGNTAPIPGSQASDAIEVTFTGANLPNNNFGELKASIHGCVYVDANNNGLKEAGEAPISNVVITLAGPISDSQFTGLDGCYLFTGLPAGTYTVTEIQPAGYLDGKDTIGACTGTTANDQFPSIIVPAATHCPNNNFGELFAPNPTPTATPTTPPCQPGSPGCPTPAATCTPGSTPCPTGTATACQPGSGTSCTPAPTCPAGTTCSPSGTPPTGGSTPPGGSSNGGTRPPGTSTVSSGAPGGGTTGNNPSAPGAPSAGDPGAPSAGTGLFEGGRGLNILLLGVAAVAASGSFLWLALARRRQLAAVAGYHDIDDEDEYR
ncbi:MAG: choice-of-anchor E domain-containing protein [Dehalococcoidia bacterium]